jgi:hypothetical protein
MGKHAIACVIAVSGGVSLSAGSTEAQSIPPPGIAFGWPTDGRFVSEKDLAGKKICWDNGTWGLFAANGQFTNERDAHTTWLVSEPGTVKTGRRYTQYLILPDGSFYEHWYVGHNSIMGHREHWGKVCS